MTKGSANKKASSASVLAYLSAVEHWWNKAARDHDNANTSNMRTENMHSLLKDVVHTKEADFFVKWMVGLEELPLCEGILDDPKQPPHQNNNLNQIAQEKLLDELGALFEEYSFVTAKDASSTDDLRRRQSKRPEASSSVQDDDRTHQSLPRHHTEDSLVYGEIDLAGFCHLLLLLPAKALRGGRFYDIGSGSGRAVLVARFLGDFQTCVGIELLSNLHDLAVSVHSLYKVLYRHKLVHQKVEFHCLDLSDYDWSDGTVVYAPSLLFDGELMTQIAEKATQLQPGAFLLSLKRFDIEHLAFHEAFHLAQQANIPMSWGEANVYVYCRNHTTK